MEIVLRDTASMMRRISEENRGKKEDSEEEEEEEEEEDRRDAWNDLLRGRNMHHSTVSHCLEHHRVSFDVHIELVVPKHILRSNRCGRVSSISHYRADCPTSPK